MEQRRAAVTPTRLFPEADASPATTPVGTPEKRSDGFNAAAGREACLDADGRLRSAAKTATRPSSSHSHLRRIEELEARLQASQQVCASLQQQLDASNGRPAAASESASDGASDARALASDYIEECVTYMLRCECLEQRLQRLESEKHAFEARLSESVEFYEMRLRQIKADADAEAKRAAAGAECAKKEEQRLRTALQLCEASCNQRDAQLREAARECQALRKQLQDSALACDVKCGALAKAACEASAAADVRAATATQAAEAKVMHAKVSAAAEMQRCRSETEQLVTELGQAKATINDFMWRCEALQCSVTTAQQRVSAASEAHRRAAADLEAAGCRAQAVQAELEAEMRGWRAEVSRLQDALAESNATVDKFIEHSGTLQQQLDASQAECRNLQQLIVCIPMGPPPPPPPLPPALVTTTAHCSLLQPNMCVHVT
jgi:chromosome segregation ATPase